MTEDKKQIAELTAKLKTAESLAKQLAKRVTSLAGSLIAIEELCGEQARAAIGTAKYFAQSSKSHNQSAECLGLPEASE